MPLLQESINESLRKPYGLESPGKGPYCSRAMTYLTSFCCRRGLWPRTVRKWEIVRGHGPCLQQTHALGSASMELPCSRRELDIPAAWSRLSSNNAYYENKNSR